MNKEGGWDRSRRAAPELDDRVAGGVVDGGKNFIDWSYKGGIVGFVASLRRRGRG